MSQCSYRSERRHILLLLLAPAIVIAQENRLVSNGTCYYAAGKQADSVYIPCGNDAFGVYACCMNGDVCLSSNACYNSQYGDTYIAGCTDSSYSDQVCGNKGAYGDLQWASLVRCFVSDDNTKNDEEWAACYESNQPVVTQHDGGCECTASAHTAVFTDNPVLTNIAILPVATGESISFQAGHTPPSDLTPTAQAVTSTTSTTSSTSSSTSPSSKSTTSSSSKDSSTTSHSSTSTNTGSSAAASSSSSNSTETTNHAGLSTGAEAGIGLGAGLGVLLICAGLFFLYRRRMKQKYSPQNPSSQPFISPYTDQGESWATPMQGQHFEKEVNMAGAVAMPAEMRSPAWSDRRSELFAEERTAPRAFRQPSTMGQSSSVSEIDGTLMTMTSYNGISTNSSSNIGEGTYSSRSGTNRGSWMQPAMSGTIRDVHELPGSYH